MSITLFFKPGVKFFPLFKNYDLNLVLTTVVISEAYSAPFSNVIIKSAVALLQFFLSFRIYTNFTSKTALRLAVDNLIVDKDLKDLTVLSFDGAVLSSAYS